MGLRLGFRVQCFQAGLGFRPRSLSSKHGLRIRALPPLTVSNCKCPLGTFVYLDSQVGENDRPLYPKVDHYWLKVAHNYEPLALQVRCICKDSSGVHATNPWFRFLGKSSFAQAHYSCVRQLPAFALPPLGSPSIKVIVG